MKAKKVQFAFGETLLIDSLQKAEVSEMTWLSITKIVMCHFHLESDPKKDILLILS